MSRIGDVAVPLALRASQAAAKLGVSESQLRKWVTEGKVHRPYRCGRTIVLFDAANLAADWDRMKEEAEGLFRATEDVACGEKEGNPWDAVLR
jgi:hypothetical protein